LVASTRAKPVQLVELSPRRRELMHFEIEFAEIFMCALVIRISCQCALIEIKRTRIVAKHAMGVAEIIQYIGTVRPQLQRAVQIWDRIGIFLVMNEPYGGGVIIRADRTPHPPAAIAAHAAARHSTTAHREQW